MNSMKALMLVAALATISGVQANDRVEYNGRIVEASKCSQNKDSSYFSTAAQRALKCSRIRLPGNDVCDATLTNSSRPSKIAMDVPGLTEHKGTRRGNISFTKGGVIVYESKQRTGAFHNKPGFFSKIKSGDQLEFKLGARNGQFELKEVMLYLDHKISGQRMSWTEYHCKF